MFSKKTLTATLMVVAMALLAAACGGDAADTPGGPLTTADPAEGRSSGSFIGLSLADAGVRAGQQDRQWRVIEEDGVIHGVTDDYSEDRLNFTVENGKVVAAATDAEMINDEPSGIEPGEQNRESASFAGLSVEEAAAKANEQGRAWRIIREDGVDLVVTDDYSEDRLNFSVEDGMVVAATTDAEMAGAPGPSSCQGSVPVTADSEVIGHVDLNDDGRDELFVLIDDSSDLAQVGIWTWAEDCTLHRATVEGSPAVLSVELNETTVSGISCKPSYVDDLYTIELTSRDGGTTYEGRITAYNLEGSELIAASGEGAAYSGEDAGHMAVLACGEITYP